MHPVLKLVIQRLALGLLLLIAASVLTYMLSHVLRPPTSMDPATARFPNEVRLPRLHDVLDLVGIERNGR